MDQKLSLEERIKILKDELEISVEKPKYTGGQSCGIMPSTVIGKHETLGIEIKVNHHRSTHKNRELLETIFDLMFDELVK